MQPELDAMPFAGGAHGRDAVGRPRGGRVGMVRRAFEAHVDVVHAVRGRPREAILETPPSPQIHADSLAQRHRPARQP